MDFSRTCRICLGSPEQTYDIFTCYNVKKNLLYLDMLTSCTKLKPCVNDGLPNQICKECCRQLRKTYAFNIQCEESDKKLRSYVVTNQVIEEIVGDSGLAVKVKIEKIQSNEYKKELKTESSIPVDIINEVEKDQINQISFISDLGDIKGDIKDEPGCVDVDDEDSCWDAEDNSLLQDLKIKSSKEYAELTNGGEKPKKKRGRKKRVLVEGELMSKPESKLPHQCDICGKFLSNKSNLKAHKICHTDLRPYKCTDCSASFRGYSALFQHKKVHSGEKLYYCEYCTKRFSRRNGLVNHIRVHTGEKLFSCEICSKDFAQSAQLSTHLKRHKGDKSYLCQECGKGFPIKSELRVHQRTHNGEKPYNCHICDKKFATSGNLSIHIRIHNKEVRYNCKECQRGFVTCSSYKVHLKRHRGQRDYHCECGKTFYTSSGLKQHSVVHTGEKKYQCKICDRKFTQTGHLSRHFKRDHAKPNVPVPSSDYYKRVIHDNFDNVFENHTVIDISKMQSIQNVNTGVKCVGL